MAAAELRLVSVLFVDLVGFTALSESREAEDVRALLGGYFASARTIVDRYAGSIQKFIGDAVMAVWGVPSAHEDDAERAVRAALEMVDSVNALAERLEEPDLRARAGVVTGKVAALENPGEGLVVGDRVNTASRVQSAAAPGSVLVDEVTRQVTSAAIVFEDAGDHVVPGKVEPLRLWRALRVVAGVGGVEREQLLETPFVGREADLRLLKDLFHGALERGSGRLVAVSGPAGVGKTRLLWEFSNYVDGLAQTFLWHSGRCLSFGDGVAYWALAEMIRQRFGIAEDASAEEASLRLSDGLDRWVGEVTDREFLKPRLGALLGVAEPGLSRAELFAGWRLFLERLAAHDPVLLVFEDLQWADAGLLDFIEHLLEWSAPASPIFMLTFARPELAHRRDAWPAGRRGATLLQLDPLPDQAIETLLDRLVCGLATRDRDRIVARAEGVPLYAIETVRALASRGVLSERDGRLTLDGELGELDVPASLGSLLAARLDALAPSERGFVKAMSVFGVSFPRSTAAALGEVPEEELDEVLSSLVLKQVLIIRADRLSPDRGQYAFAQGLLRQVAYEMLSRRQRKPRHVAAAEHLRRVFANDGEDVAEVIAAHYLEAYRAAAQDADAETLRAETVAALRRAAQRAATVGAPEVAERAYLTASDLAADDSEHTFLVRAAGQMALQSGRLEAALELLETASGAHVAAGREREAARMANDIGLVLGRMGRMKEAAERIGAALEILADEPELDAEVAALNVTRGRMLAFAGDYERAGPPVQAALQIAQALNLPAVLSDALDTQGVIYMCTGRVLEARYMLAAAIDTAERCELTDLVARARTNAAYLAETWDLPDALPGFEAALALYRRRGDRDKEALTVANLMTVHTYAGRWHEVERLGRELLEDSEARPGAEFVHQQLAIMHALRGELEPAQASLLRIEAWSHVDNEEMRAMHAATTISVLLAQGRAEEALEQGWRMLVQAIETLGPSNDAVRQAWPDTLQSALQLGRIDSATRLLALLAGRPPGHIPPYLDAQLVRGRALTAAAESRHHVVEAGLAAAIDSFRELGYRYWLAVAQTDLGGWLTSQGRGREAEPLLDEATEILRPLGATLRLVRAYELIGSETSTTIT